MEGAALRRIAHDTPDLARPCGRSLVLGVDIALVGPDRGLLGMQRRVPNLAVVQFGGGRLKDVHSAAVGIEPDIYLYGEIAVVALLR